MLAQLQQAASAGGHNAIEQDIIQLRGLTDLMNTAEFLPLREDEITSATLARRLARGGDVPRAIRGPRPAPAGGRDAAIVALASCAGLRRSEIIEPRLERRHAGRRAPGSYRVVCGRGRNPTARVFTLNVGGRHVATGMWRGTASVWMRPVVAGSSTNFLVNAVAQQLARRGRFYPKKRAIAPSSTLTALA